MENNTSLEAAKKAISDGLQLIKERKNEQVIRDSFTSHLRQIFPENPTWVTRHIQGSETALKIHTGKKVKTGFVDNLLDLTAIEYESNLKIKAKFNTGYGQVQEYCAGLVRADNESDRILGILSDTVRWFVYSVEVANCSDIKQCRKENIILKEIDSLDCSNADEKTAYDLISFLQKYLGRLGSRPVTAESISKDLGFESDFCKVHLDSLRQIIGEAFNDNPQYGELIKNLWTSFVSYLAEEGRSESFDTESYVDEYYILLLGKLICANYLDNKALNSNTEELSSIIDGKYFNNKGLINFVEYDYFGWINSTPIVEKVIPIAQLIQRDLLAYNFEKAPKEDLFGQLMAQLANRSQRLLLGQEWTPTWLSHKLVEHVVENIPAEEPLQLLDMCCGSGSMIIETLKLAKKRINVENEDISSHKINLLVQSITGFDIDPLAVILSKINWVLTALDWIRPLGSYSISIPIYHADSLFVITPISKNFSDDEKYILKIAEYSVELPIFLVSPANRDFFDKLIHLGYSIAIGNRTDVDLILEAGELKSYVDSIRNLLNDSPEESEEEIIEFFKEFINKIDILNRQGRNGIWSYIFKNSFRPGLVSGQFNGLVSNPPWLALSKIADNPYHSSLKKKAKEFKINPPGASHLHTELATIFLLHAIYEYLSADAKIGCILPETILNGHHHNPFRKASYLDAPKRVPFTIEEIWQLEGPIFKNKAVILFGRKKRPICSVNTINGRKIQEGMSDSEITYYTDVRGKRIIWTLSSSSNFVSQVVLPFRQGVDLMPRTLLFYEVSSCTRPGSVSIKSINSTNKQMNYIIAGAKKCKDFTLSERIIPETFLFKAVTSNLLTPFNIYKLQDVLLPIKKQGDTWVKASNSDIFTNEILKNTFDEICTALDPINNNIDMLFARLNIRGKLTQQKIPSEGFLVFTGAGGKNVCSAYISLQDVESDRLVLDQTVYSMHVESEEAALFYTGIFNSEVINNAIKNFQPRGALGERHIHTLPFYVTPVYNPDIDSHQIVVEKTRMLVEEYREILQTPEMQELLDPGNSVLHIQRVNLKSFIYKLNSYESYEQACSDIFN